jgi:tetratricopeptide (TPR) repeat protein
MIADNPNAKGARAKAAAPAAPTILPLFRRIDWLTMGVAFAVVWIVYFMTLAPEVTLEDSGELCTGSFYAGIPHPPGYPVWTLYTWLWTVLVPFKNVAWRVALGEATASAFACGLVGLMVSRGSSMLIEGIEELKNMTGKWENAICLVCGSVAGVLLGLGGVMWSESVAINRISLFGVPWMMTLMLCMFRWIYAPSQRRYLFFAMFCFGICLTIHQTLLVAAMGIEAAVICCQARLGRTLLLGNSIIYVVGIIAHALHLTTAFDTQMILFIFHAVGVTSVAGYYILSLVTKQTLPEFYLDGAAAVFVVCLFMAVMGQGFLYWPLALGGAVGFGVMAVKTWKLGHEWVTALICGFLWFAGTLFYFYEPIAGMTNPPMQWGYPRTLEGFIHAFTRGQYGNVSPTDIFGDPGRFFMQLGLLIGDVAREYSWVAILVAAVPLFYLHKVKKRERAWLICLVATYLCIGVLLLILMNPSADRQSAELHQVFFTSSHALIAILIGYGLALIAAYMATHYARFRRWGLIGGGAAAVVAILVLMEITGFFSGINGFSGKTSTNSNGFFRFVATCWDCFASIMSWCGHSFDRLFEPSRYGTFFHEVFRAFHKDQFGLPIYGHLILAAVPIIFLAALLVYRNRAPLGIALGLFALVPLYSGLCHWSGSEQRNHWFGYWYGHDMFTPPFAGPDGKLGYDPQLREQAMKGPSGTMVYPEMARDAILFGGTDPGRFCPTYMIFCESFIPHEKQPVQDQKFDRRDVYIITQNALADGTYLEYIRAHYNRSRQIDPPFFQELFQQLLGGKSQTGQQSTNIVARLAYQVLDRPFTALGARIEARRRREGLYPAKEIYIPSGEDGERSVEEYRADAMKRLEHDTRFPNEPRQIRPDEGVHVNGNQVTFGGLSYVMAINGILTKLIFDHNPANEFYEEESFPLEWMYPHLTPYGVIMKINRQPVERLTDDTIKRDHDFWSRYSERLIGNWITYDTPMKAITDFTDKVYVQHNYEGFQGDRKFLRDEDAQKYFSHFRGCIAGSVYRWRLNNSHDPAERQRLLKEADFAYRQAFAFAPFNAEVVFPYVTFLMGPDVNRVDDAILVAETCHKLDPNNGQVENMLEQLQAYKRSLSGGGPAAPAPGQAQTTLEDLEKKVRDHPDSFQDAFNLAGAYAQLQQRDKAVAVLDKVLANPKLSAQSLIALAQAYAQLGNISQLEATAERLVQLEPDSPEAWFQLADVQAGIGRMPQSMQSLRRCVEENAKRLAKNPKARDLLPFIRKDPHFDSMHSLTEYQQLIGSQ